MGYAFHEAIVERIVNESDAVKRFFFRMPANVKFSFRAGQFVMLHLPINSKYQNRSYSIASPPSDDNVFELCIVLKPSGKGTPYEWENFEPGTKVLVSKVLGKFVVEEPVDTDLCFIGTGTGIAPLRSQIL